MRMFLWCLSCALSILMVPVAWSAGPIQGPGKCSLTWQAPITNEDGTPLTDLSHYNLYISQTKGQFTTPTVAVPAASPAPAAGTDVTYDCRGLTLTAGQKWWTVRAVDQVGNISANGMPAPEAVADGATQADGVPFVYKTTKPGAPTGSKTPG